MLKLYCSPLRNSEIQQKSTFGVFTCCPPLQGLLAKEDLHVNMCDALANLPTSQGLEALDTFERRAASEDVRNKTGFMVRAPLSCFPWCGAAMMHPFMGVFAPH